MSVHTKEQFEQFISQLKETNTTLDFYCDFEKIKENVDAISIKLNQLNYLIGQEDMDAAIHRLDLCREKLKDNGTIWISGTYHNIFSVANCLTELGYKILNVLASTQHGEWVFDPFCGSSTTGIAANLLKRRFLGIEQDLNYIQMSRNRREEIENIQLYKTYRSKIKDIKSVESLYPLMVEEDSGMIYSDLPF